MNSTFLKVAAACLLVGLAGCISVHRDKPDAVSTTTTTQRVTTPAATTVERTTVY